LSHPLANIEPFSIFNSGAYGGADCAKSDCNGITLNGGSLTMTGVEVRNNQVRTHRVVLAGACPSVRRMVLLGGYPMVHCMLLVASCSGSRQVSLV
jgi:hypothetical protein